jgi:hypothetical protein
MLQATEGESLLRFFEWCEATWLGTAVRNSTWAFPVIESIHLLGLSMLGGAVLIVDLRMLGVGLSRQPIAGLAEDARPWLLRAIGVMVLTGVPLFLSEAVKCYHNPSFRVKMIALPLALAYTFLIRQRLAARSEFETSAVTRLVAIGSMGLWLVVAAAGRWIGFSS